MVKAYLRYQHSETFGVLATPGCNICRTPEGQEVFTGCLENISCWRVRQAVLAYRLEQTVEDEAQAPPEVVCLAICHQTGILSAGYSDGTLRLWKLATRECLTVLHGHQSAVSALSFSRDASKLASGGKDTDIVVWDTLGETGLYKLKAHTDQVTGLAFLDRQLKLISTGKDGGLRVWDLASQHCCQYIADAAGEIWSLAVDLEQKLVVIGSRDAKVLFYRVSGRHEAAHMTHKRRRAQPATNLSSVADIHISDQNHGLRELSDTDDDKEDDTRHQVLVHFGSLQREATHRVAHIEFSENGRLLAVGCAGKQLQIWSRRSPQEAAKKGKRRLKRLRAKQGRNASGDNNGKVQHAEATGSEHLSLCAADEWQSTAIWRPEVALRSFTFLPQGSSQLCRIAIVCANNTLQVIVLREGGEINVAHEIAAMGNRSDVRALALSDDDGTLLSTGSGGTKLWSAMNGTYLNSVDTGYGLSALFAPGGRYAVVGCKSGHCNIVDVGMATTVERVEAHSAQVWSLHALPDGSGFVSASADKYVKVWEWTRVDAEGEAPRIGVELQKSINTGQVVLCARVSPDGNLVAVSLISNVIKVFYLNTMKWFVDLYGHKLPALSMDISSDSALLVSGGSDKNIKIWGLDFGDCHKSLFAHQDSVMAVAFVKQTHYVFTAGKDWLIKYWDADKFELLLELPAHHAEVWCLAAAHSGDFVVSGSHDRSIRRWQRTDEPFFVSEEKEKRLQSLFEATAAPQKGKALSEEAQADGRVERVAQQTKETAVASDRIIDALDMAAVDSERAREPGYRPNPLMLGLSGSEYVLRTIADIRASNLEAALTPLPYPDALKILEFAFEWLSNMSRVELTVRVVVSLLQLHQAQLAASPVCRPLLVRLQGRVRTQVQAFKNVMGFNLAGLRHIRASILAHSQAPQGQQLKRRALNAP